MTGPEESASIVIVKRIQCLWGRVNETFPDGCKAVQKPSDARRDEDRSGGVLEVRRSGGPEEQQRRWRLINGRLVIPDRRFYSPRAVFAADPVEFRGRQYSLDGKRLVA